MKMKKFLFGLIAFACISFASAQTVTPRWGLPPQNDNTFRTLTLVNSTVTPTGTLVTIAPKAAYYNLITIASSSLTIPTVTMNVTKAYFGDKIDLVILPFAGTRTLTLGTNIIGAGATVYTITTSKQIATGFIFDGAKYQQTYYSQQP